MLLCGLALYLDRYGGAIFGPLFLEGKHSLLRVLLVCAGPAFLGLLVLFKAPLSLQSRLELNISSAAIMLSALVAPSFLLDLISLPFGGDYKAALVYVCMDMPALLMCILTILYATYKWQFKASRAS